MKRTLFFLLLLSLALTACGAAVAGVDAAADSAVSISGEFHGNRVLYHISGNTNPEGGNVLAVWYDYSGRMLGVNMGSGGSVAVSEKAFLYKLFLVDDALTPLCPAWSAVNAQKSEQIPQTGWTNAVPADYMAASEHQGTVVPLAYDSVDLNGASVQKTTYVYLPYGYDEEDTDTRYDILYLMHGWGGSAGEYFTFNGGCIRNMFDQMMDRGDIPPMIIVSPSFYNENSQRDFSGSIRELKEFHRDFEDHLMPAVERQYHTYARSVSPEDLAASRDHRAFAGFSLGSVTTWLEFCHDYDYIRYFLPMSGSCWYYGTYGDFRFEENVDFIEELVKRENLSERGFFIYAATGTRDAVRNQTDTQLSLMLEREVFTPDHVVYYQKEGGVHDFNAVQEYLYNALPLFFREGRGVTGDSTQATVQSPPVTENSTVAVVESFPAFGDFGRLLFPADRAVDGNMTLADVSDSRVYIWYSNIQADKTVEVVNYLKEQAEGGNRVFYPIYSEAEMTADPSKRDTGLFFFRGEPGAPFAVCSAGGGFVYVGAMHDSFPHALELSQLGYNAFALIYRPDNAYEDLAKAIAYIYDHAAELKVSPDGYSLWGGSAGARMAATLGNADTLRSMTGRRDIPQAAAVVMQYTGYTTVSRADAPTYACVGTQDGIASWRVMENRLNTLTSYGIPTEFHAYEGLAHGFGLGTGTIAEGWLEDAAAFWMKQVEG